MQNCKMIRNRTNNSVFSKNKSSEINEKSETVDWEVTPSGMLVQKRNPNSDLASVPVPNIRVRVKYGSSMHEIRISSQASFGELKKLLSDSTGLHPQDQKVFYKDKERDSNAYLDMVGVKDWSKLVLMEDTMSRDRRFLEMRKNAKMEKISKVISDIRLEIDNLADQVSALESVISQGEKVAENDVLNLTELLMTHLIKLDGVIADGDANFQRITQVRRAQRYIEKLDALKIKNANLSIKNQMSQHRKPNVLITTEWETFD